MVVSSSPALGSMLGLKPTKKKKKKMVVVKICRKDFEKSG